MKHQSHNDGADDKSRKAAWSEIRTILYAFLALALLPFVYCFVFDLPVKFSVQITDIQGLDVAAPAAASLSTVVFHMNLHASNKRSSSMTCYGHGEAVVRYSGFTLAFGRTRTFCVDAKDTQDVPVVAWADGVGLPKRISDCMMAEHREAGLVELDVSVKLFAQDSLGAEPTWLWCKVATGRGGEPSACSVFVSKIWASDFAPQWML